MKRKNVESSMLTSIGYDEKEKILEAEFNSGRIYQYFNVEKEVFENLMKADSHGSNFNNNVRNCYSYSRIR